MVKVSNGKGALILNSKPENNYSFSAGFGLDWLHLMLRAPVGKINSKFKDHMLFLLAYFISLKSNP